MAEDKEKYKYQCVTCDFNTNAKSNYDIHTLTKKHRRSHNIEHRKQDNESVHSKNLSCNKCNKKYSSRTGLWKHTRMCDYVDIEEFKTEITEMKHILVDIKNNQKPINVNNIQQNNNNNSNHNFNVNLFLNENFKPAKGFLETLNSIQIEKGYKETIIKYGYVKTLCDMLKDTFDQMPIEERPIYCIKNEDQNQQILHIRHDNQWKRETELEWTDQIHNYYGGEAGDDMPEDQKKYIFFGLKQMEDNLFEQIKVLYGKSVMFKNFERETAGEMNYVPNKFKIIKCLIDHVNVNKTELLSFIDDVYVEAPPMNVVL